MYFLENKRVKLLVQVCLLHEKNESAIIKTNYRIIIVNRSKGASSVLEAVLRRLVASAAARPRA